MITRKHFRWGLLGALALTLLAVQWVNNEEAPPSPARERASRAEPVRGAAGAQAEATPAPELNLNRLRRERYPESKSDLFKSDLWLSTLDPADPTGSAQQERRTGPPPPPPLPFAYMGKMLEGGQTVVFLTRGDQNFVVRKGQTLDRQYRVDQISDRTMVLTYLPGRVKQSLAIGSAP